MYCGPGQRSRYGGPRADDPLESPEIGSVKINDLAASSRPNQRYIQVSALSQAALVMQMASLCAKVRVEVSRSTSLPVTGPKTSCTTSRQWLFCFRRVRP